MLFYIARIIDSVIGFRICLVQISGERVWPGHWPLTFVIIRIAGVKEDGVLLAELLHAFNSIWVLQTAAHLKEFAADFMADSIGVNE